MQRSGRRRAHDARRARCRPPRRRTIGMAAARAAPRRLLSIVSESYHSIAEISISKWIGTLFPSQYFLNLLTYHLEKLCLTQKYLAPL